MFSFAICVFVFFVFWCFYLSFSGCLRLGCGLANRFGTWTSVLIDLMLNFGVLMLWFDCGFVCLDGLLDRCVSWVLC